MHWGPSESLRGRHAPCFHLLIPLQRVFQLLGKQALLSNLPGKKGPQGESFGGRKEEGEKGWMENVTLERAVSRILSPVVDIATEERINKPDVR